MSFFIMTAFISPEFLILSNIITLLKYKISHVKFEKSGNRKFENLKSNFPNHESSLIWEFKISQILYSQIWKFKNLETFLKSKKIQKSKKSKKSKKSRKSTIIGKFDFFWFVWHFLRLFGNSKNFYKISKKSKLQIFNLPTIFQKMAKFLKFSSFSK